MGPPQMGPSNGPPLKWAPLKWPPFLSLFITEGAARCPPPLDENRLRLKQPTSSMSHVVGLGSALAGNQTPPLCLARPDRLSPLSEGRPRPSLEVTCRCSRRMMPSVNAVSPGLSHVVGHGKQMLCVVVFVRIVVASIPPACTTRLRHGHPFSSPLL